jgi:hypothetical protein
MHNNHAPSVRPNMKADVKERVYRQLREPEYERTAETGANVNSLANPVSVEARAAIRLKRGVVVIGRGFGQLIVDRIGVVAAVP